MKIWDLLFFSNDVNIKYILWEATEFEIIFHLVLTSNINMLQIVQENCNSLAGIGTPHLCYEIQVILYKINSKVGLFCTNVVKIFLVL